MPSTSQKLTSAICTHVDSIHSDLVRIRRYLHQNPELSDQESLTTQYLGAELTKLGLPVRIAGEGRGLTADLVTSSDFASQRRIAIRGDIDALPIQDEKRCEYRSNKEGVMHACGHDVHPTIVIGALQVLCRMKAAGELPWPIAVRAILQPSEETATGARYMIHHHALADVEAILALHVDPTRKVGCVGLRHGVLTAACDTFTVDFHGQGGHGARPHLAHDPIDALSSWIASAYRRINRVVNPHSTVVLSVGMVEGGHSANVIPDNASLKGTLRSLERDSRRIAMELLEDIGEAIHDETNCEVKLTLDCSAPAVCNDNSLTSLLQTAAQRVLDPASVDLIEEPSMGSEDFSFYLEQVPGSMFRLGIAGDQVGSAPLHTSLFDVDEQAIDVGVKLMAMSVIDYFKPK